MSDSKYMADKLKSDDHIEKVKESSDREMKKMLASAATMSDDYDMKRIPRPNELKKGELPGRPNYQVVDDKD